MAGQYKGGYVKEPTAGIYKNIFVFDFRNLYPSIIVTHNIDPTTLNKTCKKKTFVPGFKDRWFCHDTIAPIPKRINGILKERWKVKELLKKKYDPKLAKKEQQLKLQANIAYGYFGYPKSPYYSVKCAESISAFGRNYIQTVIKKAEQFGFKAIYADTDSVFVTGSKSKTKTFLNKINNSLPGIIKLEYRGAYKKGLFVTTATGRGAKKKYALIDKNDKLLIKGFETQREDWCILAKNMQTEVLKLVLDNKKNKAIQHVKDTINKIKKHKVSVSDLVITVQLTKPFASYKSTSPHVSAAKKMNKAEIGQMIKFVIVKGCGSISKRAEPFDKVKVKDIDEHYYIEHQIIPSALRVLSIFNVQERDING